MKKLYVLTFIFAFLFSFIANAQTSVETEYSQARDCYNSLKKDSLRSRDKNEWELCLIKFSTVSKKYPDSAKSADALYSAARLRREMYIKFSSMEDANEAVKLYNQLLRDHPKSNLADDSLYQIAVLRHKPFKQDDKAKGALEFLIANYPNGDMVPKAKGLLTTFGEVPSVSAKTEDKTTKKEVVVVAPAKVEDEVKEEPKSYFETTVAGPFDGAILQEVKVDESETKTDIILLFDKPVAYSVEFTELGKRTKSPPRLELTLSHTEPTTNVKREYAVKSGYLDYFKLKNRLLGSDSKVLFVMTPDSKYDILPNGNEIKISFTSTSGEVKSSQDLSKPEAVADDESKKKSSE